MATDLTVDDRAELMAEGLGIAPASYSGRTSDAIVAMALVASYPRMTYEDQRQIPYVISETMGFGNSNPAFVNDCRTGLALMIANPDWVPGSPSNEDLKKAIKLWRTTSAVLKALGFTGGAYLTAKSKSVLTEIGGNILKAKPGAPPGVGAITGPVRSALKPNALSGVLVFGTAAKVISDSSVSDLAAEATRRGQLGTMTPLHVSRFGTPAN